MFLAIVQGDLIGKNINTRKYDGKESVVITATIYQPEVDQTLKIKINGDMYKDLVVGTRYEFKCNVTPWENNGRSGVSLSAINILPIEE